MFKSIQTILDIHGPVTWCRRVYLLRTTVRLCHSESASKQFVDQINEKEGQASDARPVRSRAAGRNEVILKPPIKLQPLDTARSVEKSQNEQMRRYLMEVDQPAEAKILRVSILGAPNAGKSTLVNNLINWKVNPVSTKVHTTRKNALAVATEGNTQLIFTDTPGVIIKSEARKHNCRELYRIPRNSVEEEVDLIGVVVDASNKHTRESIHRELLKILEHSKHIPSVLILNKVDVLPKKDVLLGVIRTLTDGIVGGRKVPAAPVRKSQKKKKDFKEVYNELVEKRGKLEIKKRTGPATEDPENEVPPLASEIDSTYKSSKTTKHVHTNSNNSNTVSVDSVVSSSVKSGLGKDQMSINSKNLKNERNTSLGPDVDRQLTSLKANKIDTGNSDCKQSQLETNDDKHSHSKEDIDSDKTYWDDLMPWDQETPKGWPHFDRVFIVSSTDGDGIDDLKTYLLDNAKKGDWVYHSSLVTDENPQELARQIIWSKLLEHVPGYLAYKMIPDIVFWTTDEHGALNIYVNLGVPSLAKMVGFRGDKINTIAKQSTQSLMDAFRCEVRLKISVKRLLRKK